MRGLELNRTGTLKKKNENQTLIGIIIIIIGTFTLIQRDNTSNFDLSVNLNEYSIMHILYIYE